jgi:RNA polymerase sigma-70 factor (ECF subfamily)
MVDESGSMALEIPLDSAAVAELYDTHYDLIYRYCVRRLYFREAAEDSVSEIFLTMVRRIGQFRGKTLRDFRAWLYVIAANQVNLHLRRSLRNGRMLDTLAERMRRSADDSRQMRWTALYQALLALNEDQQHLVTLRFFEGLSHTQIAELVGKRPGNIRVKIHRALATLRPTLRHMLNDTCVSEDSHGR